ncbi:MAG: hypothetical protein HFE43_05880 [Oscillospiraceae bacterium]|jgi:hypothetical protein|nr:hypothetical protein [Oscillospiraceae bacterium]
MKKSIAVWLLTACLAAVSLSGCQYVGQALSGIFSEEEMENYLENRIGGEAAEHIPSAEELTELPDRSDDHRESFPYSVGDETKLVLDVRGAAQVIVQEGEEEDLLFEYDPEHITVTAEPDDGFLVVDIREKGRRPRDDKGNYKCMVTLPAQTYEQVQLVGERAGAAFMELTAPLIVDGNGLGIVLSNPRGDVTINGGNGAFEADIAQDYAGRFTVKGSAGAFCLRFLGGEPSPLEFHLEATGSVIAVPEGWGSPREGIDYSTGSGGAVFDLQLDAGAGAVIVE